MKKSKIITKWNYTKEEQRNRRHIYSMLKNTPIPDNEILGNLSLFLTRQNLSHILFINEIYNIIKKTHGVIMEFGVRWGRNLALYETLRGIYEPYNHNRKIIGFDTFKGFQSLNRKDGKSRIIKDGAFNVSKDYEHYLNELLKKIKNENPVKNINNIQLIKGKAEKEIKKYLKEYRQTIISLAYFDFAIYHPTKVCLKSIKSRLTKGSIVAFDELNVKDYPGETLAFKEVLGIRKHKIIHSQFSPTQSYIII